MPAPRPSPDRPPPAPLVYRPPATPFLTALHADAELLAIDKPAGLLSVPGKGAHLADCVESRARARHPGALIVHRLDMDTSGVLLMAMTRRAQRILSMQFANRQTAKTYIARVHGRIAADCGEIDLPLIADWPNRPRQMVCAARGKPARTRWRVLAREPDATRVELTPLTGRSHQLRVHMLSLGHPVLGDPLYAEGAALTAAPRLQLHAARLAFRHPGDGAPTAFESPCPF